MPSAIPPALCFHMVSRLLRPAALLLAIGTLPAAQAAPPSGSQAATTKTVAIDEAHKNTHSFSTPSFRGLVELLQSEGFRVQPFSVAVTAIALKGIDVLLISGPGGWLTAADSLTGREVDQLLQWIRGGGSLLLILDHMPAPAHAVLLTKALGISEWHDGYVLVKMPDSNLISPIVFWRSDTLPANAPATGPTGPGGGRGYQGADAVLARHPITDGRRADERVQRVATFGGSAFRPPKDAEVLLTLPGGALSFIPPPIPNQVPVMTEQTPRVDVGGWAQGAVLRIGRGRVAVFGETGLFSGGPAADNRVFLLNLMRWLSGLLK